VKQLRVLITFFFIIFLSIMVTFFSCVGSSHQTERSQSKIENLKGNLEYQNGKKIFEVKCSICHEKPEVSALNMKQWKAVLENMEARIREKKIQPLSVKEKASILEFFFQNSR